MIQSMLDLPAAACNPLLIPELFQCILDGLTLPEGDLGAKRPTGAREELREVQRTLAALARTCRALLEPSLDRLWRRLDSLEPLIRCVGPAVDEVRLRARTPSSSDGWIIITRYSHRVWELALPASDVENLFLGCVSSWSQSPFLFPNLRVLRWSVSTTEDLHLGTIMDRLLSPSLVSLVVIVSRRRGIESFLQDYISLCPRLKLKSVKFEISQHLSFRGKVSMPEIHQLSQAICIHRHLESLALSIPIDDVALRLAMLSPQLKSVTLVLHPLESNLHNITLTPEDIPFRNVKDLELLAWDLQSILSLLRPKDQPFRSFRLRLSGLQEAKTIFALLTTLASARRSRSVQFISLTFGNLYALSHEPMNISYDNAAHCLAYDTLHPLASFKNLRTLELQLFNEVSLNDEELIDLACNWPMLEVLRFNCSSVSYVVSITLQGLLSLLVLCPRLCQLKLSIDARDVPQRTRADVYNATLDRLGLPDSPIRDARLVADFLSRHLPSVTNVEVYFQGAPSLPFEPPTEYSLLWAKVNEYLQTDPRRAEVEEE